MANRSETFEFVLLCFPGLHQKFQILVSITMFIVYISTLSANGIVVGLIILKEHLHQPMYMFIGNLALSDLLFDTITLPKIIASYWSGDGNISFFGCFSQLFFVHYLASVDIFIITLMAADRYIAICEPFRYATIVSQKVTTIFCCAFWVLCTLPSAYATLMALNASYCGRNNIYNCFCYSNVVYELACSDVFSVRRNLLIISMSILFVPLAFIILSYIIIIKIICTSTSSDNWSKAFYTCTTHLFVIALYFIPRVIIYTSNWVKLNLNVDVRILILCLYSYTPHLVNPVIYCLRTKEIKSTLEKMLRMKFKLNN
ncbi:hypothetical protein XENTR_v10007305 [Xenopus tropicalis]|uniref:Olfactory receptor n=1 Tax=Xenopus tropicalis TaxID=8364 RepID=A0A1B8Y8U5_XENTR|nr:olfactory receptor 1 [Xenopus tropicalis]KAE8628089.1 hypothetical protein XENTR_v10007305 [Xenopus tropicalis]